MKLTKRIYAYTIITLLCVAIVIAGDYLVNIETTSKEDIVLQEECIKLGYGNTQKEIESCIAKWFKTDLNVTAGNKYEEPFIELANKCIELNLQEKCYIVLHDNIFPNS